MPSRKKKPTTGSEESKAVEGQTPDASAAEATDAGTAQGELEASPVLRERLPRSKEVDVIRQDRSLQLVPKLFVMNGNPGVRLQEQQTIQGIELTYRFSPMSGFVLRVLHALPALLQSHARGEILSYGADDSKPEALEAWSTLGTEARAFGSYVTIIRTSRRQIAEIVGGTGGASLNRIYEALKQLMEVSIHMFDPETDSEVSTPLINIKRQGNEIEIAVNPRLVQSVAQRTVGAFSLISIQDIRYMKAESTVLLYTRLCGFIDVGTSKLVGQDRIETYIWGDALEMGPATHEERKGRKKAIMRALAELIELGWEVTEIQKRGHKSSYRLTRPRFSRAQHVSLSALGIAEQLSLLPQDS